MRRPFIVSIVLALCMGTMGPASTAPGKGTVTIVHGLPGFTADVYLEGELVLDGFEPTTVTDPLRLDPGTYDLDLRDVGAPADSTPVVSDRVTVSGGSNSSAVVYLAQSGEETVSVFENSFDRIPAGGSLLVVRDVANAPSFWVRVDGSQRIQDLRPGSEGTTRIEPGRHRLTVEARASGDELIRGTDIRLDEGTVQIVYVIGESSAGNLDLLLQSVAGRGARPTGVLTGDGGAAARQDPIPMWATLSLLAAGSGLAVSLTAMRRRRHV